MTPEQFVYWLQGKLEGRDIRELGGEELQMIEDHLVTVFKKVTPLRAIDNQLGGPAIVPFIPPKPLPMPLVATCTCKQLNSVMCPVHGWSGMPTITC